MEQNYDQKDNCVAMTWMVSRSSGTLMARNVAGPGSASFEILPLIPLFLYYA